MPTENKFITSDLLQAQYAKGEREVWKDSFYKLNSAQKKASTGANIHNGFHHTRLWLVDFSIVEEHMNIGLLVQERSEILPSDRLVTPPLCPLFSLSPAEVYQISTHCNPQDVHQLHHAITTEFSQINKFEDWTTRYAMEKLETSTTAAGHERDELQERLRVGFKADERKRAKDNKKPSRDNPAEGLQYANHAELQAHFSGRHLEDLANSIEKIKRM